MAKKTVNKKKGKRVSEELAGMHIYKDDHDRYVYYDVFSHSGYVINNIQSYKGYSNRFMLGLVAGVLIYTFDLGPWKPLLAIGAALIIYAIMEFKFRQFLKKQTLILNFQPKERPPRVLTAASETKKKIILKIILLMLFAGLIIALPFVPSKQEYDIFMKVACVAIGIGAAGLSIFHVYVLSYKSKNNIEDRY